MFQFKKEKTPDFLSFFTKMCLTVHICCRGGAEWEVGARNFMDDNDSFYKAVSQRTDIDKNSFDIIAHGTSNTINGKIVEVDHRMVARILQHSPNYHGQNIRLLSCNMGALSDGFAQNLANKLGVTVEAPSNFLWAVCLLQE